MLRYNNFIYERSIQIEVETWINIFESTNESTSNLVERIKKFVANLKKKLSPDEFIEKISSIFKKLISKKSLLIIVISALVIDIGISTSVVEDSLSKAGVSTIEAKKILKKINHSEDHLEKYLDAIAQRESSGSSGTWDTVSNSGYIGKYQFGNIALKDCGYSFTVNDFRKDPNIFPESEQDKAMVKLLKKNIKYLGKYIDKFKGKVVGGVKITKSGLLAASHLVGAKNIKKFLNSYGKHIPKDGNGTPCTEYIKKFGGYNLNI